MNPEEKISAFVWIQVAMAMLIQVLLVVFVVGFIVGHYFIKEDSKTVEVAPNGEQISYGTPPPMKSWSLPNGDQYNHRAADSEIDAENVTELGVAWTLPITAEPGPEAGSLASTPVVDEKGVGYFEDAAGNVIAVNIETGQEIWKYESDSASAGPNGVAYSNDVVYGCGSSFCFALDRRTGEEIWKSEELTRGDGEAIASAPQVKNGIVFVAAGSEASGEAIALDAASGEPLWQTSGDQPAQEGGVGAGAAAIGPDGTVFIGNGGATAALELRGGDALWSVPGTPAVSPVFSEESGQPIVLAAGADGSVDALDPKSGEQIWSTSLSAGAVTTNLAANEGVAYVVAAGGDESGVIAALEVKTGEALWEEKLPGAPFGAATISNDLVFTTLSDGTVVGVNRQSGQILWEEELPGGTNSPLVIEGDTLIAINSVPTGSEPPQIVAYRLGATAEAEEKAAEEAEEAEAEGKEPGKEGEEEAGPEGEPEAGGEEAGAEEGAAGGEEGGAEEGMGEAGGGEEAQLTEGKTAFTTNCASCHALAEAGATGAVGPDLDAVKPDSATVEKQVINGGGAMPAFGGILSEEEIKAISDYVAKVAGTGNDTLGG